MAVLYRIFVINVESEINLQQKQKK